MGDDREVFSDQSVMSDDHAKLWFQRNLNQTAINRAEQAIKSLGRALPCRVTAVNGSIVTVAFEADTSPWTLQPITIPKAESQWIRMPTQVGDKGVTAPSDLYLGGISGLGGGRADMRKRGNLSTLYFVPISNSGSGPDDPNAAQVCGPNGARIRTTTGTASSIVTNTSGTTVTYGSNTVVVNGSEIQMTVGTTALTITASGITLTVGGQTFTWGGSTAVSTLPIQAPDVILPNGAVNPHVHSDPQGGTTGPMTG